MVDNSYDALFNYAGQKYNVDPALLRTVYRNESSENAGTHPSSAGAQGGMQFLPDTFAQYSNGGTDVTDMRQAIPAAAIYLRKALDTYGSPEAALAAYHGGFDTTQWGPKTMAYVQKGIDNYPQVKADMAKAAATATPLSAPVTTPAPQAAAATPPPVQAPVTDPDAAAGKAFLSGSTPSQAPAQPVPDPDAAAGKAILATPPPVAAVPPPKPISPGAEDDLASIQAQVGGSGVTPAPTPAAPVSTAMSNTIAGAPSPLSTAGQTAAESWLAQPPTPGYERSSVLPIAVNPNDHTMGGIQWDAHGPVNALVNLLQSNSPAAVAQRGNITPDMTLALLGSKAGNPFARNITTTPFSTGPGATAFTPKDDAAAAPLSPEFKAAPVAPNPLNSLTQPAETSASSVAAPTASVQPPGSTPAYFTGAGDKPALAAQQSGGTAGPQSLSAAGTPAASVPPLTPAEAATYEGKQFTQTAADRLDSGKDDTIYVPDSKPTLGKINPALAPAENDLSNHSPVAFKDVANANDAARVDYFDSKRTDPIGKQQLEDTREAQRVQDIAPMQNAPQPVNPQSVIDLAQQRLAEGGQDRAYVSKTLNNVIKTLQDSDGNLITDPNRLYNGAYKNISDMLERGKLDPASDEATATAHLMELKTELGNRIAETNPSFDTYRQNYEANSKPIDEANVLDNVRSSIVNSQGKITLAPMQRQLAQIIKARAAPGANAAKSLTPESMDMMFNIRNDLQRDAYANDMSRGVGSNTTRQIIQSAKSGVLGPTLGPLIEGGISGAATDLASSLLGPAGIIVNPLIRTAMAKVQANRAAAGEAVIGQKVQHYLNPSAPYADFGQ